MEEKKRVVIVGGGVAGLSAGIFASRAGLDVTVYEGHTETGGNLTGWVRKGCTIDNCIHWLTGTREGNSLNQLWKSVGILDGRTSVKRHAYFYESELKGERIALSGCPYETANKMIALSPRDEREIDRFIRTVLALEPIVSGGTWNEKSEILQRIPDLLYYKRMTLAELSQKFHHPLLRLCMTDYIGGEFSAMALLFAYAAYASGNGSIPAGGSREAARRMDALCRREGCKIHTGRRVEKILIKNGCAVGIALENGERISADYVIAACDPYVTFTHLLPHSLIPPKLESRISGERRSLFSAVQFAFMCDSEHLPAFGTRIVSAPLLQAANGGRLPLREFSSEKEFAPIGKTVLQAYVFQNEQASNEWLRRASDKECYQAAKEALLRRVEATVTNAIPALKGHMESIDVWTPATYHRYFGAQAGAFLPSVMTPKDSLRSLSTKIPHLRACSLATQWLAAPGGLPTAAMAGQRAAEDAIRALCKKHSFALTLPHAFRIPHAE